MYLLSELLKSVLDSLQSVYSCLKLFCWTDSMDCLHWINSSNKVYEEKIQRNKWRIGVAVELYNGRDNYVRGCKVRTRNKQHKVSYLNRPVNKLYPLELTGEHEIEVENTVDNRNFETSISR